MASSGTTVHRIARAVWVKVGLILRQPCGSNSSNARRDARAAGFVLQRPHASVGTDQCIVQTLVVAFAMVMRNELGCRFPHRPLAEQNHPLQARFLDRPYKPFGVGV